MIRGLAKACGLLGALSISSCSLLLDWSGYTDGKLTSQSDAATPSADVATDDAQEASEPDDATADVAVGSTDALAPGDATRDAPDARMIDDRSETGIPDGSPPACSASVCGGCCSSANFCAGGDSKQTCGSLGEKCKDCSLSGLACVNNACATPPADAGAMAVCVVSTCDNLHRCIPAWQSACCRDDQTCGCQIMIPPGPCL